jgi:hypothetical protein
MNSKVPQPCDNKDCMKSEECQRFKLYLNGVSGYKTFNGSPTKACGKFIQKED